MYHSAPHVQRWISPFFSFGAAPQPPQINGSCFGGLRPRLRMGWFAQKLFCRSRINQNGSLICRISKL
jgi:hypothetical protein